MIPALAELNDLPDVDVIRAVVEHLRDGAEGIRHRQDAMVAAAMVPRWGEEAAATHASMQAAADIIGSLAGVWIKDCALDKPRRRDKSPANAAQLCADIARSGLIAMRVRQDNLAKGETTNVDAAA